MQRHSILRAAGVATAAVMAVAALASCSSSAPEAGSESATLNVTLANHVWTDIVKKSLPAFEEETGIKVNLTQLGEDQLSDQYNVKLNAGTDEIDVMMFRPLQEAKLFAQNGWVADLSGSVDENAEWDWNDFQEGPVSLTTIDGQVVGVPIITEREVLYYRTDLLEAAGLEVPQTLDELQAAAKTISESNPGVAGFVARTAVSAAVTQFSSFLYSSGGDWFDKDGNATIDTAEAAEAYEIYGTLIREYGPENVSTDMSWPEAMAIFTQGNAAFYTEADSLYKNATDPANSTISDTVGFAQFPAGPDGSRPYNVAAWALGVNADSPNYDSAWKFIEYFTSADMTLQIQQAGVPGPRTSVWDNPAGIESFPADLAEAIKGSGKVGVGYDRPIVISVPQAREIVGKPIVVSITGGDVAAAITEAQAEFQAFLDDEK
ncbi:ABC transporter substrate-binding protein [Microterricola viridarii]|uniref:Carbohydrate ABC transporter substrate-binding protein, CUT1 family n=1 Tax=Microterricola viridarii TaxID=412690 RepID=A0A1H1XU60_9MICO|nr:sugar ABC transporter substrate-binding protein [Microterricola viridarii]SDT12419.1 carbohydrate ABC transporter substrate-binding protein, CUT1 family [Microterricola viridarii]